MFRPCFYNILLPVTCSHPFGYTDTWLLAIQPCTYVCKCIATKKIHELQLLHQKVHKINCLQESVAQRCQLGLLCTKRTSHVNGTGTPCSVSLSIITCMQNTLNGQLQQRQVYVAIHYLWFQPQGGNFQQLYIIPCFCTDQCMQLATPCSRGHA